jgi:hypothetical protein
MTIKSLSMAMQLMCFDSKMVAVPCLLIFFIISSKSNCYRHGRKKKYANISGMYASFWEVLRDWSICQELKLPKFCLWHVAWSLNIRPAKFHATGKSCQKLILSSMASGIFRKQAKLQAAGKNCQKTNPINFFACCMSIF